MSSTTAQPDNLAAALKPSGSANAQVKPCCVCKDEKSARDECMLFSKSDNPQQDCDGIVQKYRLCMKGYGFNL